MNVNDQISFNKDRDVVNYKNKIIQELKRTNFNDVFYKKPNKKVSFLKKIFNKINGYI